MWIFSGDFVVGGNEIKSFGKTDGFIAKHIWTNYPKWNGQCRLEVMDTTIAKISIWQMVLWQLSGTSHLALISEIIRYSR